MSVLVCGTGRGTTAFSVEWGWVRKSLCAHAEVASLTSLKCDKIIM